MNKNVSVWRGPKAPPTNYHVWIKDDNSINVYDKTEWKVTSCPELKDDLKLYILELTKVTYAELREMRDNGELAEGHLYRITDYVTTTVQSQTKSAGHPFDVIVLAISHNALSHIAHAIAHEGDTYFDGNDLGVWELWYDLDNDTTKYEWADAENGKGVIYRMIDEKQNDCPYDFKNILFYNDKYTIYVTSDKYYYTFSYVVSGVLYDGTVEKQVTNCYGNSMGVHIRNNKKSLNSNVWRNIDFGNYCHSNTFGNYCHSNTFWDRCTNNTFGDICNNNIFRDRFYSNTFGDGCFGNIFGNYCDRNIFGDSCNNNTFGDSCYSNTFGNYCNNNLIGNYCRSNTFGDRCNNSFGDNCNNNTFGDSCYGNTLNTNCSFNTFRGESNGNKIESNCSNNTIELYTHNKTINTEKTSITRKEEYYDDGNGELVPIKHPNLSTQPSILPYKFAGNYVYEQMVHINGNQIKDYTQELDLINFSDYDLPEESPIILDKNIFINGDFDNGNYIPSHNEAFAFNICSDHKRIYLKRTGGSTPQFNNAWIRLVWTKSPNSGNYYYSQNNPRLIFNNVDAEHDGTMLYFGIKFVPITGDSHYEPSNGEKFIIEGDNLKTFMNDQTEDDGITFYYDLIPIMECNGEYIEPNPTLYRYKTQGTLTHSFKDSFPSVYNALEAGEEAIVNVYKPWTITVNVESEFVNSGYEPDVQLLNIEDGHMLGRITESGQHMDILIVDFLNNKSGLYLAGDASYGGIYNPSTEERADFGSNSEIDINIIKEHLPLTYEQIINRQNVTLTIFST